MAEEASADFFSRLPAELHARIATSCLTANEQACTYRLICKPLAGALSGPEHTTIKMSQPVPPDAFREYWGRPGACAQLSRSKRRQLTHLTASSGVLENLQFALQVAELEHDLGEMCAAAKAGHLHICQWLLENSHDKTIYWRAMSAAASSGQMHVYDWFRSAGGEWDWYAVTAAADEGHEDMFWHVLADRPPRPADPNAYYPHKLTTYKAMEVLRNAARGCSLGLLRRLWREWFVDGIDEVPGLPNGGSGNAEEDEVAVVAALGREAVHVQSLLTEAAGSATPCWLDKVKWIASLGVLGLKLGGAAGTGPAAAPQGNAPNGAGAAAADDFFVAVDAPQPDSQPDFWECAFKGAAHSPDPVARLQALKELWQVGRLAYTLPGSGSSSDGAGQPPKGRVVTWPVAPGGQHKGLLAALEAALNSAVAKDNTEAFTHVLDWLLPPATADGSSSSTAAATIATRPERFLLSAMLAALSKPSKLQVIQTIHSRAPLSDTAVSQLYSSAIVEGALEVMQWLEATFPDAEGLGLFRVTSCGRPVEDEGGWYLSRACLSGDVDTVRHLMDVRGLRVSGGHARRAFRYVCQTGVAALIRFLAERGCEMTHKAYIDAIFERDWNTIKLLAELGCPWDNSRVVAASTAAAAAAAAGKAEGEEEQDEDQEEDDDDDDEDEDTNGNGGWSSEDDFGDDDRWEMYPNRKGKVRKPADVYSQVMDDSGVTEEMLQRLVDLGCPKD